MKKITLALLIVFLISLPAAAHPPEKIKSEFNNETNQLTIRIIHPTDEDNHHIKSITVYRNDVEIINQYTNPRVNDRQTFYYILPGVKVDDELKIAATCNIFGKREVEFTVTPSTEETEETEEESTASEEETQEEEGSSQDTSEQEETEEASSRGSETENTEEEDTVN